MLHDAIQSLRPNKGFTMYGDNPDTIIWEDESVTTPTKSEIDLALKNLEDQKILDATNKAQAKALLLDRLGITEDEAKLLLS
jgi:hypothetical protein